MINPINHIKNIKYYLIFIILFPTFDLFDGFFGFSGGTVIFRLIIILLLASFFLKYYHKINLINDQHRTFINLLFSFFLLFLFLVSWSLFYDLDNIIIRDIFELHRPLYYSLIIMISMILWSNDILLHKYIIRVLIVIATFEIVLAFLHINRVNLLQNVLTLYTKKPNAFGYRSTGTFGNPYDYGIVMIFFTFIIFQSYRLEKKYYLAALSILSFIAILLSQSKTAIYVFIFCVFYCILFLIVTHFNVKDLSKYFAIIFIVTALGIVYYQDIYNYFIDQFVYMERAFDIKRLIRKSFQSGNRLYDLFWVIERYKNANILNWLFGLGIGKGIYDDIEFGYALYLYRYGLVGLILYISILFTGVIISYKAFKKAKNSGMKNYNKLFFAYHIWSFGLIIGTFANNFIDQPRITFLYFTFFGMCLGYLLSNFSDKDYNIVCLNY